MIAPLFITLRWLDVLDILIVAFLLYQLYYLMRGTVAIRILIGIITILAIWRIVEALQMELVANLLGQFIGIGAIAVIIIFQPELRNFLNKLGSNRWFQSYTGIRGFRWFAPQTDEHTRLLQQQAVAAAIQSMTASKTGALVVIEQQNDLSPQVETGRSVDAELSAPLLQSIFFKNNPLHDGAVIIRNDRIYAASCVLPVSDRADVPENFGLRHRAALGISEQSDAIALVVSEENGHVTWMHKGVFATIEARETASQLARLMA